MEKQVRFCLHVFPSVFFQLYKVWRSLLLQCKPSGQAMEKLTQFDSIFNHVQHYNHAQSSTYTPTVPCVIIAK